MYLKFESGWTTDQSALYFTHGPNYTNGLHINNGDIIITDDGTLTLVTNDPSGLSCLPKLTSINHWVGKELTSMLCISGSEVKLNPGFDHGPTWIPKFADGPIGEFIGAADLVISWSERQEIDVDQLGRLGVPVDTLRQHKAQQAQHNQRWQERNTLMEQRAILQQQLHAAEPSQRTRIYRQIEALESRVEWLAQQLDQEEADVNYLITFDSLKRWIPSLVDLFDDIQPACGLTVVAVHKLSRSKDDECVYMLAFSDGRFSVPLGLCQGYILELPLSELASYGLISRTDCDAIETKVPQIMAQIDRKVAAKKRLNQLKTELSQFGLGEERTLQILRKIENLRASSS